MKQWILSLIALFIGFNLDLIFGDPHKMPHFVRLMGRTIQGLEVLLRKVFRKKERLGGLFLVIGMIFLYGVVPFIVIKKVYQIIPLMAVILESFICYQMLAAKSLKTESMKVYESLMEDDLIKARGDVSMIVGRDTENLTKEEVTKAAVETVAENTSDGVIAPLFYMIIGGGALGMAYKAINTMDSMTGYRNERYLHFGFFPAKMDDVVNYIPARIAALLMIVAAYLLKLDGKNAMRIFKRDRYCHKSPNSAQTESVCAGALNIRLAGNAYYFGKLQEKPYIGDDIRPIEPEDIVRANRLMYGATVLAIVLFGALKVLIMICLF